MEQTVLIQEEQLLKPSQILRKAHDMGVRKIENDMLDGKGGYCALGILSKLGSILVGDTFAMIKYGKRIDEITENETNELSKIVSDLTILNDLGPHITFLDCAEFLEAEGL